MTWQTPEFVEIDMSAEIGGYQGDDFGPDAGGIERRLAPTRKTEGSRRSREAASTRLGRRRRLSAVELRLPQLLAARASGSARARPRTQESVARRAPTATHWFLLNASPEIRQQIESFPPLHPRGPRHSPIAGIVLTNGDLDHCLGLLVAARVAPAARVRDRARAPRLHRGQRPLPHAAALPRPVTLASTRARRAQTPLFDADGRASGLSIEAIAVPGKLPMHLEALGAAERRGQRRSSHPRAERRGHARVLPRPWRAATASVRRALSGADVVLLRRHLLVERRADRARARHQARRGDGALAGRRAGRQPAQLAELRGVAARADPRQQHQPAAARGLAQSRGAACRAASKLAYDGMEIEL